MGIIKVENIRIHANHGCLKEETAIGSDYRVDLKVKADLEKSASSDALNDTVDYVFLNKVVAEEMATPSALLEHVAKRILRRILSEAKQVSIATVSVSKINPPISGDVEMVTIELTEKRKS
ncbi:dihydroneopterin aldolase [Lacinutrix sp. Bg11-31]|uniref:dihydroneopterin aldolase n=1 Tax=Lacinutrix sp. Bg11-31 TaxID=2057808 RepID=UPI000C3197BE|nr:dihydroneopterin aldolase [Lacinutrix sp. Bg11-31]AUC82986.1 dihydroneopterin aldolase [Lacinutrix sp. Bg11-31]